MNRLAGELRLQPGVPVPHNLHSTRQPWAARVTRGQPASALPGLLAGLFSLCGHSHRIASQLAIHAIEPGLLPMPDAVPVQLQRETALEHLRRIGLDWPRLLAGPADSDPIVASATRSLQRCPLNARAPGVAPWPAVRQWLQDEWLQMAPATWLRAWQACGTDWLDDWSRRHRGWLPALLQSARVADGPLDLAPARALRPHARGEDLRALGAELALRPDLALQPLWQGHVAHTGTWSRLHLGEPAQACSAWSLLGCRLAELVRLCLPDVPGQSGAGWLAWGALPTGPRQGLAWVEMARGLLIHQVTLAAHEPCAMPAVAACQVLAPTEWNFHPEGVAAQALAGLRPDAPDLAPRVRLLMAALDPCVPFELTPAGAPNPETCDA